MIDEKEITCIVCPIGCKILVKTDGTSFEILKGNKCKKGIDYAGHEALDPRRMLTTSILVLNGKWPLVSVKSSESVPRKKIFSILHEIKKIKLEAPIESGEVVIRNIADTDIDIIATKTVKKIVKSSIGH
jgi:CxxC motif-containing protein